MVDLLCIDCGKPITVWSKTGRCNPCASRKTSQDPEWRKHNIEAKHKLFQDSEWQKKMIEAGHKRSQDPEWRKNTAEASRKLSQNPEWKKNHTEASRKLSQSPEWRKHNAEASRKRSLDPEWQKKMIEAGRKRSQSPKWWKAIHERSQDPEWQKNHTAAMRALSQTTEWQEKMHKLFQDPAWRKKNARSFGRKPTNPEMIFYGLILGNLTTADGFSAQQSDGHGVYDGAWIERRIVAELDGGGHHAFRDRHAEDSQKDIVRMLEGNTVLRETDENVLFLKALAILEEEI